MEENKKRILKHGPLAAIIFFVVEILCTQFIFFPLQAHTQLIGLIATELGILAIAAIGALVFKAGFKEVFPFKRIKARQFFGTLLMWCGAFLLTMIVTLAFMVFFPEGLRSGEGISLFFSSMPFGRAVLIICVLPAVCEEAAFRGFILSGLRKRIRSKWIIVIIVGTMFGIAHLDPYRFLPTAILGGTMAYTLVTTDNFIYNMMFHFINNFLSLAVSQVSDSVSTGAQTSSLGRDMIITAFAVYCILGFLSPLLILGSSMLLKGIRTLKEEGKTRLICSIVFASVSSLVILMTGIILLFGIIFISNGMEGLI